MKEKRIRVLMVEPHKHPVVTTLENNLDALQKAVSIGAETQGLIEIVPIVDGVCILCNEEGKLIGLDGNRRIGQDIIAGVFYVVGEDRNGNLTSLPEQTLLVYKHRFWTAEEYTQEDVEQTLYMRFLGF